MFFVSYFVVYLGSPHQRDCSTCFLFCVVFVQHGSVSFSSTYHRPSNSPHFRKRPNVLAGSVQISLFFSCSTRMVGLCHWYMMFRLPPEVFISCTRAILARRDHQLVQVCLARKTVHQLWPQPIPWACPITPLIDQSTSISLNTTILQIPLVGTADLLGTYYFRCSEYPLKLFYTTAAPRGRHSQRASSERSWACDTTHRLVVLREYPRPPRRFSRPFYRPLR